MDIYVKDIFCSISGEICTIYQGSITTFIRMAGCNLKCSYCDTKDSWKVLENEKMTTHEVAMRVGSFGCDNVIITGGEPLAQVDAFFDLLDKLRRYNIIVETNGSYMVPPTNLVDCWVVDYKLGSSGQTSHMAIENFRYLGVNDFVKFVIKDKEDFLQAVKVKKEINKNFYKYRSLESDKLPKFAFSPVYDDLAPAELFNWIIQERLFDVILNLQIHKIYDFL